MSLLKKGVSECVGTTILTFLGSTAAAYIVPITTAYTGVPHLAVVAVALTFGLAFAALSYVLWNVSGCHLNPAVSLGMLMAGKIKGMTFLTYLAAQIIGAFAGCGLLAAMQVFRPVLSGADSQIFHFGQSELPPSDHALGGIIVGLLVEIILAFFFVLVFIKIASKKNSGTYAGPAIGMAIIAIYVVGFTFTGTTANPARSIASAVLYGGTPLQNVWVFIVGSFVGAALAALFYLFITPASKEQTEENGDSVTTAE